MRTEKISIDMQVGYLVLDQAERTYKKGILLDVQTLKENLNENIVLWKKLDGGEKKNEDSFFGRTLSKLVKQGYMEHLERGHYEITETGSLHGGKLEEIITEYLEFEFPNITEKITGSALNEAIYVNHAHHYNIPQNNILTEQNISKLAEKKILKVHEWMF